jgi:adenine/guanine phosphoribosyltransferase-like PRPP-binding protein
MDYLHSHNHTKDIKREKEELFQNGFRHKEVAEFVKRNIDLEAYRESLGGKDNVYLVVPSTSGANTIPEYIASRLQKAFGGVVIVDCALPMHETKSAYLSAVGKLREPRVYEIRTEAFEGIELDGKNIVLVDDVVTTGTSINALKRALEEQGLRPGAVASLAQSDKRLTSQRDLERVAGKLQADFPDDKQVIADVELVFGGSLKHALNTIEREITGEKKGKDRREVYGYVKGEAARIRGEAEVDRGVQQRAAGKAELYSGGYEGSPRIPAPQEQGTREGPAEYGLVDSIPALQRIAHKAGLRLRADVVAEISEAINTGEYSIRECCTVIAERLKPRKEKSVDLGIGL